MEIVLLNIFLAIDTSMVQETMACHSVIVRDQSKLIHIDYLHIKLGNLFENNCYSANKLFDNFISIFTEVVDLFAPQRNATRKEKKLKLKPRLTPALLKSI